MHSAMIYLWYMCRRFSLEISAGVVYYVTLRYAVLFSTAHKTSENLLELCHISLCI